MASSSRNGTATLLLLLSLVTLQSSCAAFTIPSSSIPTSTTSLTHKTTTKQHQQSLYAKKEEGGTLFFADEATTDSESTTSTSAEESTSSSSSSSSPQLFSSSTLAEANDALSNAGWTNLAPSVPAGTEGEMTSEDPFVQQIDSSIRGEMGVGLDELLNPAKVVNLERDLYNLRTELAALTSAPPLPPDALPTTPLCDGGGGGPDADALRAKISKKENDLSRERRSVFRGWLKNVFVVQAVLSTALSYVMATNPDVLFGTFGWYNNVSNMDTSITVLGFWWWWLFIVPSLRSRRPSGWEKEALDAAFLGTPLVSLVSPAVTKDTGVIWMANFAVVAGAYGFAYLNRDGGDGDGDDGDGEDGDGNKPGWLKFIYKSLDFGSGRERGARR